MSSRLDILSNLKRSSNTFSKEERLPLVSISKKTGISNDELLTRFVRELERVDGECMRVKNHNEAIQSILKKIESLNISKVVISQAPIIIKQGYLSEIKKVNLNKEVEEYSAKCNLKEISLDSVTIVASSYLIAETGTAVFISSREQPRVLSILPETLFIIAERNQLVPDYEAIFSIMSKEKIYAGTSAITFMTGPSRTADIEKTIVKGVHGPKRVVVLLIEG